MIVAIIVVAIIGVVVGAYVWSKKAVAVTAVNAEIAVVATKATAEVSSIVDSTPKV